MSANLKADVISLTCHLPAWHVTCQPDFFSVSCDLTPVTQPVLMGNFLQLHHQHNAFPQLKLVRQSTPEHHLSPSKPMEIVLPISFPFSSILSVFSAWHTPISISYLCNGYVSVRKRNSIKELQLFLLSADRFCNTPADAFIVHILQACIPKVSAWGRYSVIFI